MKIARRTLLASSVAAGLAAPAIAQNARVLRFIPSSDLAGLDPIWTTGYVVRNHGYMVFDTLFATDANFQIQPQMAEAADTASDGLTCSIRLREGLRFHDNAPVRAQDCVASIRRWAARDGLGQALMAATAELAAVDDRTLRFRLKAPFPLLVPALGKLSGPVPFMMPERLALTDPNTQIREAIGSGPFRFLAGEWVQGSRAAYARFEGYVPRPEPVSGLAGGKRVNVDRVEWLTIPDSSTAMAALQTGAADWIENAPVDLLAVVANKPEIKVDALDPLGQPMILRFNHLQPPFDNVLARRAILAAVQQQPYLDASVGDPRFYRSCKSFFPCGTPMSSGAGSDAMLGDVAAGKRMLAESGYRGGKVVLLAATDNPVLNALSAVTVDLLKRMDVNVELVATEWAALLQRRASQEPVEKGGWSLFHTTAASVEYMSPAAHLGLRSDGRGAWAGWPTDPAMEALRRDWMAASDDDARKRIGAAIEQQAFSHVPYVPLGQFIQPTAYRSNVTDIVRSSVPVAWNLRKM
jgi:peptide/nickel transport system substrate-binding protein